MDSARIGTKHQKWRGGHRIALATRKLGGGIAAATGLHDHIAGLQPGLRRNRQFPDACGATCSHLALEFEVACLNHDDPAVRIALDARPEWNTRKNTCDVAKNHFYITAKGWRQ